MTLEKDIFFTNPNLFKKYPNFYNLVKFLYEYCLTGHNFDLSLYQNEIEPLLKENEQSCKDWLKIRLQYSLVVNWIVEKCQTTNDSECLMNFYSLDGIDDEKAVRLLRDSIISSSMQELSDELKSHMDVHINHFCNQLIWFAISLNLFPKSSISLMSDSSKLSQLPILVSAIQESVDIEQSQHIKEFLNIVDLLSAYIKNVGYQVRHTLTNVTDELIQEKLDKHSIYHLYLMNLLNSLFYKLRVIQAEMIQDIFDSPTLTKLSSMRATMEAHHGDLIRRVEQLDNALAPLLALGTDFTDMAKEMSATRKEIDNVEQEIFHLTYSRSKSNVNLN